MTQSMNFLRIILLLTPALLVLGCGAPTLSKDHIELDPEVAAQVKVINMEHFRGHWLMDSDNRKGYLELNEDGYYMTVEDSEGQLRAGDSGSVDHFKPGLMIVHTDRPECVRKGKITFLKMDRADNTVRLRDYRDDAYALPLVAIEPRERLRMMNELGCVR
ncbi:hypothetical protein [Oligoflexus tunisiensis]|uniref:hypothetical protein n=1 Tax=Oligoflexus tunisiensis TaxID=708132 RepID=UPI00114D3A79|nr:hypothetical protein [Oligoflexus tunisiensis]